MPRQKVPDAWDDDWQPETASASTSKLPQTQQPGSTASSPDGGVPLTAAERIARHKESNRRLWQSADAPEDPQPIQYLPATNNVTPTVFKPAMKVLSRRPGNTPADDSDSLAATITQPTQEQMRLQREEKQRRYNEARAKIFGEPSASSALSLPTTAHSTGANNSGTSTPGTVTPPLSDGGTAARHRRRGSRGNARGGRGGGGNNNMPNHGSQGQISNNSNNSSSLNGDGQVRRTLPTRELFDPNSSPKPRRGGGGGPSDAAASLRSMTPRDDEQGSRVPAVRAPRGPDGTGRGGFGFSNKHVG